MICPNSLSFMGTLPSGYGSVWSPLTAHHSEDVCSVQPTALRANELCVIKLLGRKEPFKLLFALWSVLCSY